MIPPPYQELGVQSSGGILLAYWKKGQDKRRDLLVPGKLRKANTAWKAGMVCANYDEQLESHH